MNKIIIALLIAAGYMLPAGAQDNIYLPLAGGGFAQFGGANPSPMVPMTPMQPMTTMSGGLYSSPGHIGTIAPITPMQPMMPMTPVCGSGYANSYYR